MVYRLYTNTKLGMTLLIGTLLLFLFVLTGWVLNILKLFALAQQTDPNIVMGILRAIGIVLAPLGAIIGYL
jgi:hypothetical protein